MGQPHVEETVYRSVQLSVRLSMDEIENVDDDIP